MPKIADPAPPRPSSPKATETPSRASWARARKGVAHARPGASDDPAHLEGGLETRVERLASVLTDLKTQSIVSSSPADHEIEREIEAEKLKARKKISRRRRRAARVLLAEI